MTHPHQAWVEVDLDALDHNISVLKELAGEAAFAAVVKSNGYGLGALAVADAAVAAGAAQVCVFNLDEAAALRQLGFATPIQVLGSIPPSDAERAVELDVAVTVSRRELLDPLAQAAAARGARVRVHVKVEAGMYRLGAPAHVATPLADAVRAEPSLRLAGLCAHFPSADGDDATDTKERFARFLRIAEQVRAPLRHVANTATLLRFPQMALEMVRVGAGMYGIAPGASGPPEARGLRPVMTWKAAVIQLHDVPAGDSVSYGGSWTASRDSRIGVVACGYGDGFRRSLENRGEVLVNGSRAPAVGAICMDTFLVDLTDVPDVRAGDVAVIVGEAGAERMTLDRFAELSGTIAYEVCTSLGARLARVYVRAGRPVAVQTLLDGAPIPTTARSAAAAVLSR